jgi:hypothetical protein
MPRTNPQRRREKELRSRLAEEARRSNAGLLRAVFDVPLVTATANRRRRYGQLAAALKELYADGAEDLLYRPTGAPDITADGLPAHVLLGYTREETLSPTILDLVAGDMCVKIAEAWRTFYRGRSSAPPSADTLPAVHLPASPPCAPASSMTTSGACLKVGSAWSAR